MSHKRHLRFEAVQELASTVESWMAGQSDKQTGYDNLRMEGRELRADLQSSVENLERNVRFSAGLPPIEQLIHVDADEEIAVWRERLASIFSGLLRANPHYQSIVYSRIVDKDFTELVRVERHSTDQTSIRIVPRSRLRTDKISGYIKSVVEQKPEEVLTSLVEDPLCERTNGCAETVGLLSATPVFDNKTEDIYGVVMINCDLNSLLRQQMNRRMSASEIIIACDVFHNMMHSVGGQISEETVSKPVAETSPYFLPAIETLQSESEFIDTTNSDVYGARLWLIPNKHGLMYLLKRKGNQNSQ